MFAHFHYFMDETILTVSALTEKLSHTLENTFPFVWVKGEITNLSRPASGHIYFSLRDEESILNCVWFKNQQRPTDFDILTGEVYEDAPRESLAHTIIDGDTVLCAGQITVYSARGQYQLQIEHVQFIGEGDLLRKLEILKQKLAAQGFFNPETKRPLPSNPQKIAVITAPKGAAIHDFIRIASVRGTGANIRIVPVVVQGESAPAEIAQAIKRVNRQKWADVIVIIRGGGSLEDLWAFNDERLVRAVAMSNIPTVSGVGHEVDFSLCDLAADVRAATPSHAAQILWKERTWYSQMLDGFELALSKNAYQRLHQENTRLEHIGRALSLCSPIHRLQSHEIQLKSLALRFEQAKQGLFIHAEHQLDTLSIRLEAASPHAPLARGYATILNADGSLIRSVHNCLAGDKLTIHLQDGTITTAVIATYPNK